MKEKLYLLKSVEAEYLEKNRDYTWKLFSSWNADFKIGWREHILLCSIDAWRGCQE